MAGTNDFPRTEDTFPGRREKEDGENLWKSGRKVKGTAMRGGESDPEFHAVVRGDDAQLVSGETAAERVEVFAGVTA